MKKNRRMDIGEGGRRWGDWDQVSWMGERSHPHDGDLISVPFRILCISDAYFGSAVVIVPPPGD